MYDCTNKGPHSPVSGQRKYVGGIVLGLRRIGKSSLVLATLSSTGHPFVYVDVRRAYDDVSRRVPAERLYEELRSSLLRLSVRERVLEALRRMGLGAVSLLMIDS